jgi:hypothetical protein
MDKVLAIFGVLSLALLAVLAGAIVLMAPASENAPMAAVPPAPGNSVIPNDPTTTGGARNDTLALARLTVMSDPTYMYDGMDDTLKFIINDSSDLIIVTTDFTSRHAGYGNRSDMMVADVLTSHQCIITISQGKVQSAVMDGMWDMIAQKELVA